LDDLRRLDANGDIRYEIDFRSIYSTILRNWLGVQDELILNDQFEYLDFI
ncbi:MAG: twin-arginine translocation pathway signal, partial [Flavobacteriaceae bacterium]|nr:twin-arginine translocation pathway signal [Flavobacteriaceae bacterium]